MRKRQLALQINQRIQPLCHNGAIHDFHFCLRLADRSFAVNADVQSLRSFCSLPPVVAHLANTSRSQQVDLYLVGALLAQVRVARLPHIFRICHGTRNSVRALVLLRAVRRPYLKEALLLRRHAHQRKAVDFSVLQVHASQTLALVVSHFNLQLRLVLCAKLVHASQRERRTLAAKSLRAWLIKVPVLWVGLDRRLVKMLIVHKVRTQASFVKIRLRVLLVHCFAGALDAAGAQRQGKGFAHGEHGR